jgi:hypothetical protein
MEVCPGQVTAVESDHCAVDPDAFSHLTGHHRPGDFTMAWHQQFGCGDAKVRDGQWVFKACVPWINSANSAVASTVSTAMARRNRP